MSHPQTDSDVPSRRGRYADPQKAAADAHVEAYEGRCGGAATNAGENYASAYASQQQQLQQQQQQQQQEYLPYSSYVAFASNDADEDAAHAGAQSTTSRYLLSRPAPLQTTASTTVPGPYRSAGLMAASGSGTYTTTNTRHMSPQAPYTQSQEPMSQKPSPSNFVQRDTSGSLYDLGSSLSQLSPILPPAHALPSLSNASLPGRRSDAAFTSVPGSQALRGSFGCQPSLPRSRATSAAAAAAGSPLTYTSALPVPTASPTTLAQLARLQRMNDGFVREDTELDFNGELAASLPSTTLASPSFGTSSFASPLYPMAYHTPAAETSGRSSAQPPYNTAPRPSGPASQVLSPLTTGTGTTTSAGLEAAVYGPSDGVVLQFPQFVDFASRTEAMYAFGLDQVLDADIVAAPVEGPVDAATAVVTRADVVSGTPAVVAEPRALAPCERLAPRQASFAAPTMAPAPRSRAVRASTGLSTVAAPAPTPECGPAVAETAAACPTRTSAAAPCAGDATPKRATMSDDTEDPSPRPHLPPAGGSTGKPTTTSRPADYGYQQPLPHTTATAPSTHSSRPYSSSTAAYMKDAGEPADAAAVSPFDASHLRATHGRQAHHTSLFSDEETTSTTIAAAEAPTTRPFKSPALSPYSAPWSPATGTMLTPSAVATTTTTTTAPASAAAVNTPLPRSKMDRSTEVSMTPTHHTATLATPAAAASGAMLSGSTTKTSGADTTKRLSTEAYEPHADLDNELAGLTLSQHRSTRKLQQQQQQQAKTASAGHARMQSPQLETPMRKLPMSNMGTALQQALDEAESEDMEVRVVMPYTTNTNDVQQQQQQQQSQPVLGQALRALIQQVKDQPQHRPSLSMEPASGIVDSVVLHAQPAKGNTKRSAQARAEHTIANNTTNTNDVSIFSRPDSVLQYAVTVVGHLNLTSDIFSTAPVEKDSYVLYEADRGEDIGCVLTCQMIEAPKNADGSEQAPHAASALRTLGSFQKHRVPPHVLRPATASEVQIWLHDQAEEARVALQPCREAVERAGLPLTVVGAVYQYNKKKLTFYYDSNVRVDFRQLLQTLFSQFHCRIWMEKISTCATLAEA